MSGSDTDDTDILILIPPNFFNTKETDVETRQKQRTSESLKTHVVKGLLNHVNELEDRVSTIETLDSSRTSYYSDGEMNNRYSSAYTQNHLVTPPSLSRTPVRRQTSTCHSTPCTVPPRRGHPKDHLSKSLSPRANGTKNERQKLISEIDNFYALNSKALSKHNDSDDNLGISFENIDMDISHTVEGTLSNLSTSPPHIPQKTSVETRFTSKDALDLPAIERILKQVEATQSEFEEKLKRKEEDFNLDPKRTYSCNSNLPELNFGLRNVLFENSSLIDTNELSKNQTTPLQGSAEPRARRKLDLGDDSNASFAKESTAGVQEFCKTNFPADELSHQANSIPAKLLSLSELWKQAKLGESPSSKSSTNSAASLRRKIEEEKYRREHCEQLIQQLQFRLLEEQEKVAVALRVDSEKDRAIRVLQGGWARLVTHWREIEAQRHELTNRLIQEKRDRASEVDELNKKVERYEREVAQVVNLAADYKDKAEKAEADKNQVQGEASAAVESMREGVAEMKRAVSESSQKLDDYQRDRKLLADKLTLTEEELDKEKLLTKEVSAQLEELKVTLRVSKEKIEMLERSLDLEMKRSRSLDEDLQDARRTCEEVVKKEQKAEEEISSLQAKSATIKNELRDFYQKQLNSNVKEKLKEFQSQLDAAELTLHREFQTRERTIVENAAKQLKQISDKLVSDFKSKCDAYEMENLRLKRELGLREAKLKDYHQLLRDETRKREMMAREVERVMQSQLQQAIHKIRADVGNLQLCKESPSAKRQPSEISLIDSTTDSHLPSQPYIHQRPSSNSELQSEDMKHIASSENAMRYEIQRSVMKNQHGSADNLLNVVEKDVPNNADMKKYIEMLLERSPGVVASEVDTDGKGSVAPVTGTSFLESSVTSDIFNEVTYPRTTRPKSNDASGSQSRGSSKKIWK